MEEIVDNWLQRQRTLWSGKQRYGRRILSSQPCWGIYRPAQLIRVTTDVFLIYCTALIITSITTALRSVDESNLWILKRYPILSLSHSEVALCWRISSSCVMSCYFLYWIYCSVVFDIFLLSHSCRVWYDVTAAINLHYHSISALILNWWKQADMSLHLSSF